MTEICQYRVLWQISDRFIYLTLTVFWHSYEFWHILETFPNLIWHIYDTILNLTDLWHLYDTFQTLFWQFFVTDSFLTDFRQISDTFLKFLGPTKAKSTEKRVAMLRRDHPAAIPLSWKQLLVTTHERSEAGIHATADHPTQRGENRELEMREGAKKDRETENSHPSIHNLLPNEYDSRRMTGITRDSPLAYYATATKPHTHAQLSVME